MRSRLMFRPRYLAQVSTWVIVALFGMILLPGVCEAKAMMGDGNGTNLFNPKHGLASKYVVSNATTKGPARTGDVIVAFNADTAYLYTGPFNASDAKRLTGHVGLYDGRKWSSGQGLNSLCVLWYDDGWLYDRDFYRARWVTPNWIRQHYDAVYVVRPKSATPKHGIAVMDYAKSKTTGSRIGLDGRMVNGKWYREAYLRQLGGNVLQLVKNQITSVVAGWGNSAVFKKMYVWMGATKVVKVAPLITFPLDCWTVITKSTGNYNDVKLASYCTKYDPYSWYGSKVAFYAWGHQRGFAGLDPNNGKLVLPIDLISPSSWARISYYP